MHVSEIKEQLEQYGLEEGKNFIDIYSSLVSYFKIKSFENKATKFIKQLDSIPGGLFKQVKKFDKPIGIVCSAVFERIRPWFALEQCLLLRYYGYDCVCIVDCLKGFDEYVHFEGITEISIYYINKAIAKIREICPDFRVKYITYEGNRYTLSEREEQICREYSYEILKWFDSRKEYFLWRKREDRVQITEDILKKNLSYIKQFFVENKFSTINVSTGAHKHRCLYKFLSNELDMRLITYDGGAKDPNRFLYTTNGISSHHKDVARLINEKWFGTEEQEKLYIIAENEFKKRINSTRDDDKCYFQLVKIDKIKESYDVIMPLNISWDAAALFQNRLFKNDMEWIHETVKYIMENTDCNVLIREHPCKVGLTQFDHPDLRDSLRRLSKYGERVHICLAEEKINTYSYVNECKLVLPYSSTVGLEAVALGKKILVHTDCYYSDIGISEKIYTKEQYFERIKYYVNNSYEVQEIEKRKAILALLYLKNDYLRTEFTDGIGEWLDYSWEKLLSIKETERMKDIIINNIPALYFNLKDLLI